MEMSLAFLYVEDGHDFSEQINHGEISGELCDLLAYMSTTLKPLTSLQMSSGHEVLHTVPSLANDTPTKSRTNITNIEVNDVSSTANNFLQNLQSINMYRISKKAQDKCQTARCIQRGVHLKTKNLFTKRQTKI